MKIRYVTWDYIGSSMNSKTKINFAREKMFAGKNLVENVFKLIPDEVNISTFDVNHLETWTKLNLEPRVKFEAFNKKNEKLFETSSPTWQLIFDKNEKQ